MGLIVYKDTIYSALINSKLCCTKVSSFISIAYPPKLRRTLIVLNKISFFSDLSGVYRVNDANVHAEHF
jgi:hypothetical protein